jgi:hypothetical protein
VELWQQRLDPVWWGIDRLPMVVDAEGGLVVAGVMPASDTQSLDVLVAEPPSDNAVLILKNKADLVVSTLSGRVAVFAEAGTGPFEVSAERELISWSGPSASENVFTNDYSLPLKYLRYVPWTK